MDEMVSITAAANILGVSRPTVYAMVADGILSIHEVARPSLRGTTPGIARADIDAIIERRKTA